MRQGDLNMQWHGDHVADQSEDEAFRGCWNATQQEKKPRPEDNDANDLQSAKRGSRIFEKVDVRLSLQIKPGKAHD